MGCINSIALHGSKHREANQNWNRFSGFGGFGGHRRCQPHLHRDWGPPLPTSAPGLTGLSPVHRHRGLGGAHLGRSRPWSSQVHRHRICGDFVRLVPPALLHVFAD